MIYTYQHMIEGCVNRDVRAWQQFIQRYLPLARQFVGQYFPGAVPEDASLARLFAATLDGDGEFFRSFGGRTERELMVHFRHFVLARARTGNPPAAAKGPLVTLETLEAALKNFSALQRELVWLYALAYAPEQLGPVLGLKPGTAGEVVERAQEQLRKGMEAWSRDSLRVSGWSLMDAASQLESKDCHPLRIFQRMLDGQITWQDHEAVLAHVVGCFRCVDRLSTLQETVYYARMLPVASSGEVERVVELLGFPLAPARKKSLVNRWFS